MKTKEELAALKNEVEALNNKLAELTDEELAQVVGGSDPAAAREAAREAALETVLEDAYDANYKPFLDDRNDPQAIAAEAVSDIESNPEKIADNKHKIAVNQRAQYRNSPYLELFLKWRFGK